MADRDEEDLKPSDNHGSKSLKMLNKKWLFLSLGTILLVSLSINVFMLLNKQKEQQPEIVVEEKQEVRDKVEQVNITVNLDTFEMVKGDTTNFTLRSIITNTGEITAKIRDDGIYLIDSDGNEVIPFPNRLAQPLRLNHCQTA